MTYNLLTTQQATPDQLASVLSAALHVEAWNVDVADAYGDPDLRNWEALVSCEYTAVRGDLAWSLDIYVQDQVAQRPSEADLAAHVAAATTAAVLFPAESDPPSAYWVATPERRFTRARLLTSDTEEHTYTVDAVEEYVHQLPSAEVKPIPEVVAELQIATPVSDAFEVQIKGSVDTEGNRNQVAQGELRAISRAGDHLGAWEKLVNHMAAGWSGSGWCPPDLYRRRLEARDGLEVLPNQLPPVAAAALQAALQQLDSSFAALTIEDHQGVLIQQLLGEGAQHQRHGWWWYRRPEPLPWQRR